MAIQPFTPPQFGMQQTETPQVKKQKGTGFTNIGQMLQANIGAGKQMAQQVGKNVGLQAGKVAEDVTKSKGAFETAYGGALKTGKETLEGIKGLVGQVGEGGTVGTDLSGLTEEEAKLRGKQLAETKYTGPMGLEGDILKRAEGLKGLGQTLTSGQGRSQGQLIGSTLARTGPYTMGQSLLDTALIGQDIAAQNALRSAALEAMKTSGIAETQESAARQQAQMAQQLLGGDKESGTLRSEIQKSIGEKSGLLTKAAEEKAKTFAEDIERLKVLLPAKINELKTGLTPEGSLTEKDKQLITDFESGKYGNIEGLKEAYTGDEDAVKSALNTLISGMAAPIGGTYYTPEQQKAAQNLQLFLKKQEEADKLKEYKYDTDVYKSGDTDAVEKGILSTTEASRENKIKSVKNEYLNFANNVVNKNDFTPNLQKISPELLNYVNETMDDYTRTIQGRVEMASEITKQIIPYLKQQLNSYDWSKDPRTSKTNLFDKIKENLGMKEKTKNKIPTIFKLNDEIKNKIKEAAKKLSDKWRREQ